MTYGFAAEPRISIDSPSFRSGIGMLRKYAARDSRADVRNRSLCRGHRPADEHDLAVGLQGHGSVEVLLLLPIDRHEIEPVRERLQRRRDRLVLIDFLFPFPAGVRGAEGAEHLLGFLPFL